MDKSIKQIIFCVFWGSHVDQVLCPWTLWNPVCPTVGAIGSGEHSSLEDSSRACNARRWIVKLCTCLRNHWGLFFPGLFVYLFIITTYQSHSPFFLSFHPPIYPPPNSPSSERVRPLMGSQVCPITSLRQKQVSHLGLGWARYFSIENGHKISSCVRVSSGIKLSLIWVFIVHKPMLSIKASHIVLPSISISPKIRQ